MHPAFSGVHTRSKIATDRAVSHPGCSSLNTLNTCGFRIWFIHYAGSASSRYRDMLSCWVFLLWRTILQLTRLRELFHSSSRLKRDVHVFKLKNEAKVFSTHRKMSTELWFKGGVSWGSWEREINEKTNKASWRLWWLLLPLNRCVVYLQHRRCGMNCEQTPEVIFHGYF